MAQSDAVVSNLNGTEWPMAVIVDVSVSFFRFPRALMANGASREHIDLFKSAYLPQKVSNPFGI